MNRSLTYRPNTVRSVQGTKVQTFFQDGSSNLLITALSNGKKGADFFQKHGLH